MANKISDAYLMVSALLLGSVALAMIMAVAWNNAQDVFNFEGCTLTGKVIDPAYSLTIVHELYKCKDEQIYIRRK